MLSYKKGDFVTEENIILVYDKATKKESTGKS